MKTLITFSVQHLGYVQVFLGDLERQIQVFDRILAAQAFVIDQVRSMTVNESAKGETVLEAHVKVLHVHILVRLCLALTPEEQTLFSRHFYSEIFKNTFIQLKILQIFWCQTFDRNVLDGKSQNNSPDHAEGHFEIAVDNFLGTDGHQFDALALNVVQALIDVGNLVETHFAAVRLGQLLARYHLEE